MCVPTFAGIPALALDAPAVGPEVILHMASAAAARTAVAVELEVREGKREL